ncbi:hypothetical protein ACHAXA_008560 [Cyclostephanos tholiformis]|uniref:Uncharacterized protein n=1 Tax=Cyclostephanos tholiformis TaxID=382380 RepID=A0ABD3RCK2_9STRA
MDHRQRPSSVLSQLAGRYREVVAGDDDDRDRPPPGRTEVSINDIAVDDASRGGAHRQMHWQRSTAAASVGGGATRQQPQQQPRRQPWGQTTAAAIVAQDSRTEVEEEKGEEKEEEEEETRSRQRQEQQELQQPPKRWPEPQQQPKKPWQQQQRKNQPPNQPRQQQRWDASPDDDGQGHQRQQQWEEERPKYHWQRPSSSVSMHSGASSPAGASVPSISAPSPSSDPGVPEFMRMRLRSSHAPGTANIVERQQRRASSSVDVGRTTTSGGVGDGGVLNDDDRESESRARPARSGGTSTVGVIVSRRDAQRRADGRGAAAASAVRGGGGSTVAIDNDLIAKLRERRRKANVDVDFDDIADERTKDRHQFLHQQQKKEEEEEEVEKEQVVINQQQQQLSQSQLNDDPSSPYTISNVYNTAVLAAKNAIDMSNLSRDRGRGRDVQSLPENPEGEYPHEDSFLSHDPSLHMDPSPEPSITSSFGVEREKEEKKATENHVGRRQLLPPTQNSTESPAEGEEENLFDQSFVDASNNTFHQLSRQLPSNSITHDIASQQSMTNDDNDGFNNNVFDSFDPFFHEDEPSSDGDGNSGHATTDDDEEEFTVDAPNFVDSDIPGPRAVMASFNITPTTDQGQIQQGGVAAAGQKYFSSFRVRPLEISSSAVAAQPCQNPLSGNVILCHRWLDVDGLGGGGDIFIEEFDFNNLDAPLSSSYPPPVAVLSTCISTDEIKAKLARGEGVQVLGVASILSLAAGIHRVQGRARVRVAALIEIYITSQNSYLDASCRKIRIVVVWRWGYNPSGTHLASLQSVLTIDSIYGEDSRRYDPKTLQVADGLLFLGGNLVSRSADSHEATTMASIFFAKPAARHSWTAVPLRNTYALNVVTLAVANDSRPYLAVGLSDGSVQILTYDLAARTNRLSGHMQTSSLFHTLCYMRGELEVRDLGDNDYLWPEEERFFSDADHGGTELPPSSRYISTYSDRVINRGGRGGCTSLAWINHDTSGISSLPLLAAAFSSGIAVYHVLTSSTHAAHQQQQVLAVPRILPLAQSKFISSIDESEIETASKATQSTFRLPNAEIGWFDLGPRSPPGLALLFEHEKLSYQHGSVELIDRRRFTRLCLCAIDIPIEIDSKIDVHRPIGVICQKELNVGDGGGMNIVNSSGRGSVVCYSAGSLLSCEPMVMDSNTNNINDSDRAIDGYFSSLLRPVASAALGLDSDGSVYLGSLKSSVRPDYQDVMLTVFSVTSCVRDMTPKIPSQRHWLLISSPGDGNEDRLTRDPPNHSLGGDSVNGGASTDILFELTCGENPVAGLVPQRIAKEEGGRRVAVMFSSGFFGGNFQHAVESNRVRTHTRITPNTIAYSILDIEDGLNDRGSTSFKLLHGRDVTFLPPLQTEEGLYCSSLVVLDVDGSTLSLATVISSIGLSDGSNDKVIESIQKCSLQYEAIEGRRVFALLKGKQPRLLLSGYSTLDERPCLLLSKHSLERGSRSQLSLVENSGLGHRFWLRPREEVLSLLELPRHSGVTNANVAVATQERVMILSSESDSLVIIAEIDVHVTCASLSPLGSHCVAFCASSGVSNGVERSRLMYLSCLEGTGGYGIIATLPTSRHGKGPILLAAIRPDRLVYFASHSVLRMMDEFEDGNAFIAPLACTRPLLLLEPLIANALCQDLACGTNAAINDNVQRSLRITIEKFGRKDMAFPHCDNEGFGTRGTGITSQVYNMLAYHKCFQAASILLTGNSLSDIISQPKILPPWVPIQSKLSAATGAAMIMQVLSYGDTKLAELLRHSDGREVDGAFPGLLDLSSILSEELAFYALNAGSNSDAIKLLGLAGRQSSVNLLAQLIISLGGAIPPTSKSIQDFEKLLKDVNNTAGSNQDEIKNCSKFCLNVGLRLMRRQNCEISSNNDASGSSVLQLAPSVQSVWETETVRSGIMTNHLIGSESPSKRSSHHHDAAWKESLIKSKHIWTSGPLDKKDLLLQLSEFGDWLGRCCPTALGMDGVAIAAEKGEQTLAEILCAAGQDGEVEGAAACSRNNFISLQNKWVEGVGEGREDEDNLSLYIRFSEGADEDGHWKSDGFTDLTKHAHIARLFGCELASVEATSSSVDEGEEGKVRLLYDLVYHEGARREQPTGLVVDAPRGGPLDIGMLHSAQHTSRQRCSVELWYHLPQAHVMHDEIILVRRSLFYEENCDASTLCMPDKKHNILWELAVLSTGLLELRTGAGSVVTSTTNAEGADGLVSWERADGVGGWNHVCIVFSPLSHSFSTELSATILMNGSVVVQGTRISVNPFGSEYEQELCKADIEEAMEKTVLIFGIGPSVGFRMTELRVWSCQRSEDDINMMMYEYLRDAEMKRKLKVNIRKDAKVYSAPLRLHRPDSKKGFALAPPPKQSPSKRDVLLANAIDSPDIFIANFPNALDIETVDNPSEVINMEEDAPPTSPPYSIEVEQEMEEIRRLANSALDVMFSDLLSTKIKKSAAAAIIRGPPAARHFGGNRGGLLSEHINFGSKCDGVGPIVICGAEKSVVWFNDRDPPGRTVPIGASGAVLSDIVDENMSEYMCCFLAKEKRMVVFELSRKTVVIELQMKTKLNYWRYLPPEAHGSSLVFVLITPIGGFHWKPLDLSPRPFLVWKRGPELESKKILSYEEGGSNGLIGINARSTVALVVASSASPRSASVEAYCIAMYSGHVPLCISNVILGAALYRPAAYAASPSRFLPFVITISKDITSQTVLDIEDLLETSGSLVRGSIVASTVLDLDDVNDESHEPPSMSMGYTPEVLCCCHDGFIVVVVRRKGFILAYDFSSDDELILVGKSQLGRYVVDAAVRSSNTADESVELVVLLCESEDPKDGRVASINISRSDGVSSQYSGSV